MKKIIENLKCFPMFCQIQSSNKRKLTIRKFFLILEGSCFNYIVVNKNDFVLEHEVHQVQNLNETHQTGSPICISRPTSAESSIVQPIDIHAT